jgi:transcriptional regulator with XRE-family HTH domain
MLLHEELRRARESVGLTQAQLANLAGIPRNQIVRAETGENITLETLRKIVVHLPVENLTLLEGTKLGFDNLPQAERLYGAAAKMLISLSGAFMTAVETTIEAKQARDTARQKAELETPDELLPYRALKNSLLELNEALQEDPAALREFEESLQSQGLGSAHDTMASAIAHVERTLGSTGLTVENEGSTLQSEGSTLENEGSTLGNEGSTLKPKG